MKKKLVVFAAVILIALFLRFYPIATNSTLMQYDSYYHLRIAQETISSQAVLKWDPALEGRPHIYPPLYHVFLVQLHYLTGFSLESLAGFINPLFNVIFIALFALIYRKNWSIAILAAFLIAVSPGFIDASFDSPQNMAFLFLPAMLLLLRLKRFALSGFLLGVWFLTNYFSAALFAIVLIAYLMYLVAKKQATFRQASIFTATAFAVAAPWVALSVLAGSGCLDITVGNSSLSVLNSSFMPILFVVVSLVFVPLAVAVASGKLKVEGEGIVWVALAVVSFAGVASFPLASVFHPWEHVMLISIAFAYLIAVSFSKKVFRKYFAFIIILFFVAALLHSTQVLNPRVSDYDFDAFDYAAKLSGKGLMDPNLSSAFLQHTGKVPVLALFFECIPEHSNWQENFSLLLSGGVHPQDKLAENDIGFVIVDDENQAYFDTTAFSKNPNLNKVFDHRGFEECSAPQKALSGIYAASCGKRFVSVYAGNN
ncbi:MAG: hypothetical protein J7K00_05005 [Candidatus Diapherotrites archaeon]|nr:hypothetical protein [Candidatus Diapherotrites archaeon]